MFISVFNYAQGTSPKPQDSTKTGYSLGQISLPNPKSIIDGYTYDPVSNRYIYTASVDDFNINYPLILTPEEYEKLVLKEFSELLNSRFSDTGKALCAHNGKEFDFPYLGRRILINELPLDF